MIRALFLLFIVFCTAEAAFSRTVSFETIQSYHDKKAQNLIMNYGLDGQVDLSVTISPRKDQAPEEVRQKIQIPGILLGGIEDTEGNPAVGAYDILEDLKNYTREITIVKKRPISEEEITAFQAGIRDQLVLREDETINVQDTTFTWSKAAQFWSYDLQKSIYDSLFSTKYWSWLFFF